MTCDERLFQKLALETDKAHLPTVERLNGDTSSTSWLKEADLSDGGDVWDSFSGYKYVLQLCLFCTVLYMYTKLLTKFNKSTLIPSLSNNDSTTVQNYHYMFCLTCQFLQHYSTLGQMTVNF